MPRAATILPERLESTDGLLLRRWAAADAEALSRAVAESIDHLRPWMGWIADEPMPIERRRARIEQWEQEWRLGGDVLLGIFLDGEIAGSCGLHRRIAADGLELGYWTHPDFVRRGLATRAAEMLSDAALSRSEISHVEIHHDKANTASAGVPPKLGFEFVGERHDEPEAPAEVGIEWQWRMRAEAWNQRRAGARPTSKSDLGLVLIGGREQRPIVIADYDPVWPKRFETERGRIREALACRAIRVEHFGSTAVPGLAAKPIVDVLVTVDDPDDEEILVQRLEAIGYELRVREPGHRMFRTPARDLHVHVWRESDPEVDRVLRFRDRLRRSADDRRSYEELKRALAKAQWSDMNDYADAKTPLIDAILAKDQAADRPHR